MEEIIRQQNERRKSELDALQSQINPHFLYNTLESITWMIEAQKNEEAVIMISEPCFGTLLLSFRIFSRTSFRIPIPLSSIIM